RGRGARRQDHERARLRDPRSRARRDGRAVLGHGRRAMKALLCDIDGVILHDETALPGAPELVERLVGGTMPFLFLTNYPSQTPADLRDRFRSAGIATEVPVQHFYTSAIATAEFLSDQAGDRRKAYVIGEGALIHALYEAGFILTENEADFVVLGE